ncbi:PREDICTED: fatty acid amide hydrolase-like isoform X1 [Camelina sativa]|uniref:Fatty acid amide hydrolase-like isoform X1 n=1 Tax=Camelina sativa TaxID=90675 RepID=A0ABM0XDB5_CAMSA|nr:PREDICTED: fatty acid amide hydrolase-like isoform X1 [Camelina sativa]XP_010484226.1 PREDICTED: fatty acid amide hydrolase-like isoform X1 [Camelina sativa]
MGKYEVMKRASEVDVSTVKYKAEEIKGPHLTGFSFKLFVNILEAPLIGPLIVDHLKKDNGMTKIFRNTVIPEEPMFRPEFPSQEPELDVVVVGEDRSPIERLETALKCLPQYDSSRSFHADPMSSFRYWKIRDFAYAYRSKLTTPLLVAKKIISIIEEFSYDKPPTPFLISFDANEVIKQAEASTQRFEEGNPISVLDGIFVTIKDDIDCLPYPTNGGTTWLHEGRSVEKDSAVVSKLRSCGAILLGKANMHELGMGTTGNNSNYGTTRNPHDTKRYTGGSSSGSAAIVASGLCSAALGTDGGGSVRVPASLCGITGLKTTYGRTDMTGSLCEGGTVEIIGPLASSLEDTFLVYAAILGSSSNDRITLRPTPPCFPKLLSHNGSNAIGSLRLGKYTAWFNDVNSSDISDKCEDILKLLSNNHGCKVVEIVVPELEEMRAAHVMSIGSPTLASLTPYCEAGKNSKLTYDTRTSFAIFRSFSASDYIAAQCLRRRLMEFHMNIFKDVDVIVTPTAGMTAPLIPPDALKNGETNLQVTTNIMRFALGANLLGFPAISVPVGYDKKGLPIGLQIMGRPWAEATILGLAAAIEELAPVTKKPAVFYDILNTN